MRSQWHYSQEGQNQGPISSSELKALANDGKINRETLIWKEGMKDWMSAKLIQGLFPSSPPQVVSGANQPPPTPKIQVAPSITTNESVIAAKKIAADVTAYIRRHFHLQRIAIIGAASVGALSIFMPWVTMPMVGTVSGARGDGWLTFLLFIPPIVLALRGNKLAPLTGGTRIGAAVPAALAGAMGLYKIVQFNSAMTGAGNGHPLAAAFAGAVRLRFGVYLLVLAAIAVCVAAWILEKREQGR